MTWYSLDVTRVFVHAKSRQLFHVGAVVAEYSVDCSPFYRNDTRDMLTMLVYKRYNIIENVVCVCVRERKCKKYNLT